MAVSVSTQPYCTTPTVLRKTHESLTIAQTYVHFPALFHSFSLSWYHCTLWGSAPSREGSSASGSLQVIGLSEIGLDFCSAGSGVTEGFERGSPWSLPSHVHTCLLGIPLHFQALLCLWPWSLESPRKCIPLPALNDHITLNPLGSMIPLQSWKTILLLVKKAQRPSQLI